MEKKVIVRVNSTQVLNGEEEKIELITTGRFYKKESTYYVVYEETEISGMKGTTTTVKIEDEEVSLIRFGTTNTRLRFKKGIKDISLYRTPYGVLEIIIVPLSIVVDVDDSGGEIRMVYELEAGGQETSTNELFIKIQRSH